MGVIESDIQNPVLFQWVFHLYKVSISELVVLVFPVEHFADLRLDECLLMLIAIWIRFVVRVLELKIFSNSISNNDVPIQSIHNWVVEITGNICKHINLSVFVSRHLIDWVNLIHPLVHEFASKWSTRICNVVVVSLVNRVY